MEVSQRIFGLNEKETEVYVSALELGEATGFQIYKKTKLKKPTVYYLLDELLKRKLVFLSVRGKKKYYVAEDPSKIKQDIENKLKSFDAVLPQLLSIYNTKVGKPRLRYYEGKEGLKEVYGDTLKYQGEILAFASDGIVSSLGEDFTLDYVKNRAKKRIWMKAIVPDSGKFKRNFIERNFEQLRVTKLVNPKEFGFPIEINIYSNRVAFMSFRDELGLIIESDEIASMMKMLFTFFWNNL